MPVNRRTLTLIIVVVAVIAGVYAITWWQRSRETQRLLKDLQDRDHAVATEAIEGLRDRVPAIRDELLAMLTGGDNHTRWRAAELLGFAGGPQVREALTGALTDSYPDVRLNAALSLARLNARDAAAPVATLAADPDEELPVRIAAVNALRSLRADDQLDTLIQLVEARPEPPPAEEEVAPEPAPAAPAPGTTAPAAAAPAVEAPAPPPDETWLLRVAAVRAVAILAPSAQMHRAPEQPEVAAEGAAGDLPELEAAGPASRAVAVLAASTDPRQEPHASVRQAACYALGDLLGLSPDDQSTATAIQALVDALGDEISDVRIAAVHTLNIIDVPPADVQMVQDALTEALNDDHYWVRQAAMEATHGG